jgi:hypothetical protein
VPGNMTEVSSLIASAMQMVTTGKNAGHWNHATHLQSP